MISAMQDAEAEYMHEPYPLFVQGRLLRKVNVSALSSSWVTVPETLSFTSAYYARLCG